MLFDDHGSNERCGGDPAMIKGTPEWNELHEVGNKDPEYDEPVSFGEINKNINLEVKVVMSLKDKIREGVNILKRMGNGLFIEEDPSVESCYTLDVGIYPEGADDFNVLRLLLRIPGFDGCNDYVHIVASAPPTGLKDARIVVETGSDIGGSITDFFWYSNHIPSRAQRVMESVYEILVDITNWRKVQ